MRWRPVKYESRLFEVVMKYQTKVFCNTWPNSLVCFSFPFSLFRTDGPDLLLAIAVLLNATQCLAVRMANMLSVLFTQYLRSFRQTFSRQGRDVPGRGTVGVLNSILPLLCTVALAFALVSQSAEDDACFAAVFCINFCAELSGFS